MGQKSPQTDPHLCGEMIFNKGANGKKTVFPTNGAGKVDIHCWRMRLDPYFTPYTKIPSKFIKDLQ